MKLLAKILVLTLFVFIISVCNIFAEQAINFSLKDLSGKTVELEQLKGKVVFLDFWASWCPPCRQSIPAVEALYDSYKGDDNVCFIGINLNEDKETVSKFVNKQGISYTVLLSDKKVITNYKIRSIPAFYIIDKDGKIANTYLGYKKGLEQNWKEDIKKLLDYKE